MDVRTHHARITGQVHYTNGGGVLHRIPLGPCLLESADGRVVCIVWGAKGQRSVALPVEEIRAARDRGHLVLLD